MTAYYNEFDPFAAAWLRELIHENLIAPGEVDERSIKDVIPNDLKSFTQCHFFAGIGGWSYALRLAGWPDDRLVWTGSCPCQPFSAAGKRKGVADERHLWPEFRRLIEECGPATVFGEQVASKDGRVWLDGVRTDLEALGYAVGAADLCAAGIGAPHIRQRLYWLADANQRQRRWLTDGEGRNSDRTQARWIKSNGKLESSGANCGVADANGGFAGDGHLQSGGKHGQFAQDSCAGERVADSEYAGRRSEHEIDGETSRRDGFGRSSNLGRLADAVQPRWPEWGSGSGDGPATWSGIFIPCSDGKYRRVPANEEGEPEPALFPLANGIPNRMGTLRGAGNAIVPQVAAAFILAAKLRY